MNTLIEAAQVFIPVFLLVLLNGYFVATEFALVRSLASKLRSSPLKEAFGSKAALKLLENLDESISTTQLGITVASLVLGWFGEQKFHHLFSSIFEQLQFDVSSNVVHTAATIISLSLVTFMHVVLGELVAKSIAIRFPETALRIVAPTLVAMMKIAKPFVMLMNSSANLVLSAFGIVTELEGERVHTTSELAMLIAKSGEKGELDKDEEEMLQGIIQFSETIAREVMTPRMDLVTVSVNSTFQETIEIISQSGFSRFPVIDGSMDKIVGVLLSRDLLPVVERYVGASAKKFSVKDIVREPYFIPGTKSINDLLKEFKQRKLHMAIVLDEHGGVDGAVTLEDLLEEIVGDIFDESDAVENDIVVDEGSGDIIVDGGVAVDDINQQFELSIPDGEYDTIAGFIMSSLGRVPMVGESIAITAQGLPVLHGQNENDTFNGAPATNGAHSEAFDNGGNEDGINGEDFLIPSAVLIVEALSGNRIEAVRIQQLKETTLDLATAVGNNISSSKD